VAAPQAPDTPPGQLTAVYSNNVFTQDYAFGALIPGDDLWYDIFHDISFFFFSF